MTGNEEPVPRQEEFRSRVREREAADAEKYTLIYELLDHLSVVEGRLAAVTGERDSLSLALNADLEMERAARRLLQQQVQQEVEKVQREVEKVQEIEKSKHVLVLIDADADMYLFHEKYVKRREKGGEEAASDLMEKCYANLSGLPQAYKKGGVWPMDPNSLSQFLVGFTRKHELFDFVDIGAGKEEADHKIRGVLEFYAKNKLCKHILLGCCHDMGYVPVLRKYETKLAGNITLLQVGRMDPKMAQLKFSKTTSFSSLFFSGFACTGSPVPITPVANGGNGLPMKPLVNIDRFGPIMRSENGKRIDRPLSVSPDLVKTMRKQKFCYWYFLRNECKQNCPKDHRKASTNEEFDAVWFMARFGLCAQVRSGLDCIDKRCIYGH